MAKVWGAAKAIETRWHGWRFRSRVEGRWAVFLDALDLRFSYEPEGFDLEGVRYLPDFWLPELGVWMEVKGQTPNDEEIDKVTRLVALTGRPAILVIGEPDPTFNQNHAWFWADDGDDEGRPGIAHQPHGVRFYMCRRCQMPDVSYGVALTPTNGPGGRPNHRDKCAVSAGDRLTRHPILSTAYARARATRFGGLW